MEGTDREQADEDSDGYVRCAQTLLLGHSTIPNDVSSSDLSTNVLAVLPSGHIAFMALGKVNQKIVRKH